MILSATKLSHSRVARQTEKMRIIAVGLNPAIDRTIEVRGFRCGGVVRGKLLAREAAGKATNLVRTLAALGHSTILTGFLGEEDIPWYKCELRGIGVEPYFVAVPGATRQNTTILDPGSPAAETHICEEGFAVDDEHIARLNRRLRGIVEPGDIVAFCGSLPSGMTHAQFLEVLLTCVGRGARLAIDTSGEALRASLAARPFLLKPNMEELSFLAGKRVRGLGDVRRYATTLLDHVDMLLVSLGRNGAAVLRRGHFLILHARDMAPPAVVNTVGCGDALLAGFLAGLKDGHGIRKALRLAVACGSACAASRWAALRSREEIIAHLPNVQVTRRLSPSA